MRDEGKTALLSLFPHPSSLIPQRSQLIVVATALIPMTAEVVTSLVQC